MRKTAVASVTSVGVTSELKADWRELAGLPGDVPDPGCTEAHCAKASHSQNWGGTLDVGLTNSTLRTSQLFKDVITLPTVFEA